MSKSADHATRTPRLIAQGVLWLVLYILLIMLPVALLLLPPRPQGSGFWYDFSLALGFAATTMMGVQFALTARFHHATAPYGIDIVYSFHRHLAVVGTILVLAHPIILIVINPALLHLLQPRHVPSHMLAGIGSIVCLLALVASSLWRKQLRLHYDGWRIAHAVLAVAAVGLALLHIEGVSYYIGEPRKHALWLVLVGSWLLLVLRTRLVKPWLLSRWPYRVVAVERDAPEVWTLTLEPDGHRGIEFEAGQFAWLTLAGSPFAMHEHPFSIASSPVAAPRLQFTIKELGDFTRTIGNTPVGAIAYVDGPYGAFSMDRYPEAPGYVLIAGGIGIVPMVSMLRALADRGDQRPLWLIGANSRLERVALRDVVSTLALRLNLRVIPVLEEPPANWQGEVGYLTADVLNRCLPAQRDRLEYFVCGPTPMIHLVEHGLYSLGVPMARFHTELFDLV